MAVYGNERPFLGKHLGKGLGMARGVGINRFKSELAVRKLAKPGLHADGGKLYLRVGSASQKSWVFLFQWGGKTREMGLGSLQDVGLRKARELRDQWVAVLADGHNPIEVREAERAEQRRNAKADKPLSVREAAKLVVLIKGPKTEDNRRKWVRSIENLGALADMPPVEVQTAHVVAALLPHWHRVPVTADLMRQRLQLILDWAHVSGAIPAPWSNPARWGGHLEFLMEQRERTVTHRAALDYRKVHDFIMRLRGSNALTPAVKNATEWALLTATRSHEARAARWEEIDLEARVWTVPAARMKLKKRGDFRVPLSDQAMAFLKRIAADAGAEPHLFPTREYRSVKGYPSVVSLRNAVVKFADEHATPHGFRSTFKDWSLDIGGFTDEIGEECLAHKVGNNVRNAYRRDDNLENRRRVMQAWADFLDAEWVDAANVVPLTGRKAA